MAKTPDLGLIGFEVQLYLADKYNLDSAETAIVFTQALADTIAYGLKPGRTADVALEEVGNVLKQQCAFRIANPLELGLRELIAEYRRTGGKVRTN